MLVSLVGRGHRQRAMLAVTLLAVCASGLCDAKHGRCLTVRHRHSLQTRELEAAVLECLLIALGTSFVMCLRGGCYGQSGDVCAVQHETFACGLVLGHSHRYFHKVVYFRSRTYFFLKVLHVGRTPKIIPDRTYF